MSIFAIVVASMAAGWATPTESAAIGAFATLALALAYRALSLHNLTQALRGTSVSLAGTGIWISDGATNIMPVGPHRAAPTLARG